MFELIRMFCIRHVYKSLDRYRLRLHFIFVLLLQYAHALNPIIVPFSICFYAPPGKLSIDGPKPKQQQNTAREKETKTRTREQECSDASLYIEPIPCHLITLKQPAKSLVIELCYSQEGDKT